MLRSCHIGNTTARIWNKTLIFFKCSNKSGKITWVLIHEFQQRMNCRYCRWHSRIVHHTLFKEFYGRYKWKTKRKLWQPNRFTWKDSTRSTDHSTFAVHVFFPSCLKVYRWNLEGSQPEEACAGVAWVVAVYVWSTIFFPKRSNLKRVLTVLLKA